MRPEVVTREQSMDTTASSRHVFDNAPIIYIYIYICSSAVRTVPIMIYIDIFIRTMIHYVLVVPNRLAR